MRSVRDGAHSDFCDAIPFGGGCHSLNGLVRSSAGRTGTRIVALATTPHTKVECGALLREITLLLVRAALHHWFRTIAEDTHGAAAEDDLVAEGAVLEGVLNVVGVEDTHPFCFFWS